MFVIGGYSIDLSAFTLIFFITLINLILQAIITLISVKCNKLLDAIKD